jgi:hypothetical protein
MIIDGIFTYTWSTPKPLFWRPPFNRPLRITPLNDSSGIHPPILQPYYIRRTRRSEQTMPIIVDHPSVINSNINPSQHNKDSIQAYIEAMRKYVQENNIVIYTASQLRNPEPNY